ncbi:hypothetical protein, variant [Capsaspora owczarzaki ATCC 30864]|uniref:Mitochondrial import inner membrane translocase subunit Tim23 n=1 Tax=Capsaspora owczarzaki (strain ATCC 30864) TaxID=595528 RepID=A0A0D2WJ68_CAPO3|nr:hypothetical protein, variant [Capsaspora owczarzaki ATCC 30864]
MSSSSSVYSGDYSADDRSLNVPVTPNVNQVGRMLSSYAWQYDPAVFANTNMELLAPESVSQAPLGIGHRVCYGTGTSYLAGAALGTLYGVGSGLRNPDATSTRLKVNSVLNSVTRHSQSVAHTVGVVALVYTVMDGVTIRLRDGQDDAYNTIGCGIGTGLLLRSACKECFVQCFVFCFLF